ncbi:hypothetical protein AAF712_012428 [Marasmius tenuissimus]|uniref:Uncharacterized protein n=1 Tax=Marasmius tenuissimus TaxID=585030 RepID=A0ABR2ZHT2_9AGAR
MAPRTKNDELTYFDEFSRLPRPLVLTALQVTSFAAHFLDLNEPKSFQWPEFLRGINEYRGGDLTLDKFQSNSIHQQEATVSTMVERMVGFLRTVLSVALRQEDIDALHKSIELTFTDLKTAKEKGWADFSGSSTSSQLVLAVSLVTTINLEANIREEHSWWGLTSSTRRNFSAKIDAMQLIVIKGFRDPR